MKIIEVLNNGIKKFAKGMFALFTLNILIFCGVLLIQSCQTDDEIFETNSIQNKAMEDFAKLLIEESPKVQEIISRNQIQNKNYSKKMPLYQKEINYSLNPLIESSKNLLYSFNFNNDDINDVLENEDPLSLILFSVGIISSNAPSQEIVTSNSFNKLFFINSANAYSYKMKIPWAQLAKCAKKAFGLDDLSDFKDWGNMKKGAQKKLLKRVAGKMAARYASAWVGVAIIVGEFGLCIY